MTVAILCDVLASISFSSPSGLEVALCTYNALRFSRGTWSTFISLVSPSSAVAHVSTLLTLVSYFPLPYSPSRVHARRYRLRSYFLLLAASLLCTSTRSIKLIASSAYPIPRLFLFYHQASPFPFLKHRSPAQTPFRASSSSPIMSASLRLAADGNTRPPRLQPSPSLPNLRCVH
jgi:hypothetical protein